MVLKKKKKKEEEKTTIVLKNIIKLIKMLTCNYCEKNDFH